ncbi:hypothetical protein ABIA33_007417, partial [Streptacidiphilus sp. MAP12-16]
MTPSRLRSLLRRGTPLALVTLVAGTA